MPRENVRAAHRHVQLEHVFLTELTGLLRDELDDPRLGAVVLLNLTLSADGKSARVFFGLPQGADARQVGGALARAAPYLRWNLAQSVECKHVPALTFVFVSHLAEEP